MPAVRARVLILLSLALSSFHLAPAGMPEAELLQRDPEHAVRTFFRARPSGLSESDVARLAPVLVTEAERAGLTLGMVLAVIEVESGGRSRARSHRDARGLMQILPATGRALARDMGVPWRGPESLYDPVTNVRLGVVYLAQLLARFGDVHTALAAYNAGPSRVARLLASGRPVPTGYAERVLAAWRPTVGPTREI
jgi:soluble lytic murein transglycosylase-like protein